MADAKIRADIMDTKGAALAHAPSLGPHPSGPVVQTLSSAGGRGPIFAVV
jgi:hypothetical protein